jgi:hypothetical protein
MRPLLFGGKQTVSTVTYRQNHLERQEQLKKKKLAAGLVSDRFPGVSEIVLMVRTLNFLPTDYAYFHMDCMREECTDGGFDLMPVVAGLVKNRKKTGKGKICCDGKNEAVVAGHASIAYEVSIQNAKHPK